MHADRTNRVTLLLLALLFIAVGLGAGAASLGVFGTSAQHSRLMTNPVGHFIGSAGGWLWPAIAAAAAILLVLALRWLLALLFSTDRSGDLPIRSPGPDRPHDPCRRRAHGGSCGRDRILRRDLLGASPADRQRPGTRARRCGDAGGNRGPARRPAAHRNGGAQPRPLRPRQSVAANPAAPGRDRKIRRPRQLIRVGSENATER